jgi:hypothetical protein
MGRAKDFLSALSAQSPEDGLLAMAFRETGPNYFRKSVRYPRPTDFIVHRAGPGQWVYRVFKMGGRPGGTLIHTQTGSAPEILAAVQKHKTVDG